MKKVGVGKNKNKTTPETGACMVSQLYLNILLARYPYRIDSINWINVKGTKTLYSYKIHIHIKFKTRVKNSKSKQ